MTARDPFTDTEPSAGQVPAKATSGGVAEADSRQATPAPATSAHLDTCKAAGETCGSCGNGTPNNFGFIVCSLREKWRSFSPKTPCDINAWCTQSPQAAARRAAQDGIEQAVSAADREVQGWSDLALRYVRLYATQNRGKQFIGHDIVQASIAAGIIQPPNSKAWGSPIQRAVRERILTKVGYAEDANRHLSPVPLYEAAA